MEWYYLCILAFGLLMLFLFAGMPIVWGMGLTGMIALLIVAGSAFLPDMSLVAWNNLNSFTLTALPLYILMGNILAESGVLADMYGAFTAWLYRVPGGLLQTNIVACSIFAAISGSSVANAATMSRIAIPPQLRMNYERKITFGSVAAGGTLGILIPPSIPMILYGSMTDTSVGRLFMAGLIPGLVVACLFMLYIAVRCTIQGGLVPSTTGQSYAWKARVSGLRHIVPVLLLVLIILGGIYTGIMTATEAAGVSVVIALIIAAGAKRLNWGMFSRSCAQAARMIGFLGIILVGAMILGWALALGGVVRAMGVWAAALPVHPLVIIGVLIVVYIFLGCLIEGVSMMVMTLPIVFPVVTALGFDPVWFGIIMVFMLEFALITPPVGMNLFVVRGVMGCPISEVIVGVLPFLAMHIAGLALVIAFPQIALWLPSTMIR